MKIVILGAKNPETGFMMEALARHGEGRAGRLEFHGFIDNDPARHGTRFLGLPVFGGFEMVDALIADGCKFVNTITRSTVARHETSKFIRDRGGEFVNFIHPSVRNIPGIGTGNYIQEHVILQEGVEIADNCSIHAAAVIAHETTLGASCFIAPAASVSGLVRIGRGVFIGSNATILPRLRIGNWATIGAGAVVFQDVPDRAVVAGNPARIIRYEDVGHADGGIAEPPPRARAAASP